MKVLLTERRTCVCVSCQVRESESSWLVQKTSQHLLWLHCTVAYWGFCQRVIPSTSAMDFPVFDICYISEQNEAAVERCSLFLRNWHQTLTFDVLNGRTGFICKLGERRLKLQLEIAHRDFMFVVFWHFHWNMTDTQPNNEMETCKVYCQRLCF